MPLLGRKINSLFPVAGPLSTCAMLFPFYSRIIFVVFFSDIRFCFAKVFDRFSFFP